MTLSIVILAAGEGLRMKSKFPKVLHELAGRPLIDYAMATARAAAPDRRPVVVIGSGEEAVRAHLGDTAEIVVQAERLGTGHAVLQTRELLAGRCRRVLVSYADMPLLRPETLRWLVREQEDNSGPFTMLTAVAAAPRGFGRVVRNASGGVQAIVEEAAATPEQLAIRELNAGVYCFEADWLWGHLDRLPLSAKGEYYLTDLAGLAIAEGLVVRALPAADPDEVIGVNTRLHLAEAEAALRRRINRGWLENGVMMPDPATVYVGPDVVIGQDTVIYPNTHLIGRTSVGEDCRLGPNAIIRDTIMGEGCKVLASDLQSAELGNQVEIGPFARLRKGARLRDGVHVGNFGEIKNSTLGPGVKMGHFSYVGDATLGEGVNIGAGTVTCNYDGVHKYPTVIGAGAFIGSDTMLVAPVTLGEGAKTGAGAVVTRDIPPNSLAVGQPARVIKRWDAGGE